MPSNRNYGHSFWKHEEQLLSHLSRVVNLYTMILNDFLEDYARFIEKGRALTS